MNSFQLANAITKSLLAPRRAPEKELKGQWYITDEHGGHVLLADLMKAIAKTIDVELRAELKRTNEELSSERED